MSSIEEGLWATQSLDAVQEATPHGLNVYTVDHSCDDPAKAWQQLLAKYLAPFYVLPSSDIPFRGQLRCIHLDPMDMMVTTRTSSVNHRTRRLIAEHGDTSPILSLHLGGDWMVCENRSQQWLHPGDIVLWDLTRPMTLASLTSVKTFSLKMPPEILGLRPERLFTSVATKLPTHGRLGALIAQYLRWLAGQAAGPHSAIATRMGAVTADLVATYFAELLGEPPPIEGSPERTLLRQIKFYIKTHLGEPHLRPATIAAAHHISVRSLHKLFVADGHTVASWVRQRRLERACQDLVDPAHAGSSITTVACQWGFVNSAHFSRVFKATFGASPRDYRKLHGGKKP